MKCAVLCCAVATAAASGANFVATAASSAAFALSNVFGDHMVLQRDVSATIWGFGAAGATVSARISTGASVACPMDEALVWRCSLPATPAGGPYNMTFTQSDGQTVELVDVLFGEVFLVGGQSNAVFSVSMAFNASAEIADATEANYPTIRLMTVGQYRQTTQPQVQLMHISQPWTVVSPAAVAGPNVSFAYFSAIGWFFGRDLYKQLGGSVPIGLINNNWGGTVIQEWTPSTDFGSCPQAVNPIPHVNANNSDLFDPMIHPYAVGPMAFAAVVWYQAESNIDIVGLGFGGAYYACQFPVTIAAWRRELQQPNLPWLFVQLASYTSKSGSTKNILPDMRQGQLDGGLSLPHVYFATAMDMGDPGSPWTDIHPRKKQPVGQRLASVAAAQLYGQNVTSQGPMYSSAAVLPTPLALGSVSIAVNFTADSLPGNAVVVVNASMGQQCPSNYNYTAFCAAYVVTFDDGSTVEVQADAVTVQPGGKGIIITAPLPAADARAAHRLRSTLTPVPVATAYAYAPWAVTSIYTADGWPAVPWNRTLSA